MKAAGFAPLYCAMYPELATLVRTHGYALAIHGSLARDFDLIAIPWTENPSVPRDVVDDLAQKFAIEQIGEPSFREHGREIYTMRISFGQCFLDLSFMPRTKEELRSAQI